MTVNVRFPDDLHRELVAMAEQDDRSLNGEIVHAVRQFIASRRQPNEARLARCAESKAPYDA